MVSTITKRWARNTDEKPAITWGVSDVYLDKMILELSPERGGGVCEKGEPDCHSLASIYSWKKDFYFPESSSLEEQVRPKNWDSTTINYVSRPNLKSRVSSGFFTMLTAVTFFSEQAVPFKIFLELVFSSSLPLGGWLGRSNLVSLKFRAQEPRIGNPEKLFHDGLSLLTWISVLWQIYPSWRNNSCPD